MDVRGAILICGGMGLAVLGFQEASTWGWTSAATLGCIFGGLALIGAFVAVELRVPNPLIEVRIFGHGGFAADNVVLFLVCACFVPLFFFASVYAQVVLGYNAGQTGLYILVVFIGFAGASQIGGRILDRRGARPAAIAGSGLAAAGFALWANHLHEGLGSQWPWVVMAGAGIGLVLTPVSTDAVNRAPRGSYGEVTGVTQTVRYFAASLGLAVLGTVLIDTTRSNILDSLTRAGVPRTEAARVAASLSSGAGAESRPAPGTAAYRLLGTVQHDYADATRVVYLAMAGVMAAAFIIALRRMERGIPGEVASAPVGEPAEIGTANATAAEIAD